MIAINTIIVLVILALILSLLFSLAILFGRSSNSDVIASQKDSEITPVPCDTVVLSPIRNLDFTQAFNLEKFFNAMKTNKLEQMKRQLESVFGSPDLTRTGDIVSDITLLKNGDIKWTFSDPTKKILKSGEAELTIRKKGGQYLPTARSKENKRFIENLRGRKPDVVSKVAKVGGIVVSTAHIISGADLVKRLKAVNKKIDFLIAARKIDQMARLESNYKLAREILCTPMTELNEMQIMQLHKENMELRSTWRQEVYHKLSNIEDQENRNWIKRWFTRRKTTDKKISAEICQSEIELRLINFSIAYDVALCDSIEHSRTFIDTSLREEMRQLKNLKDLLNEKAVHISKIAANSDVEAIVDYLDVIHREYQKFIKGISEDRTKELEAELADFELIE